MSQFVESLNVEMSQFVERKFLWIEFASNLLYMSIIFYGLLWNSDNEP